MYDGPCCSYSAETGLSGWACASSMVYVTARILIDVSRELEDLDLDDIEVYEKGSDDLSDFYTCPLSPSLCVMWSLCV